MLNTILQEYSTIRLILLNVLQKEDSCEEALDILKDIDLYNILYVDTLCPTDHPHRGH